ncbi:MAG TPA: YeeE/YedE thiosulfate transporter family protein, partial [Planctomycetota bacterium]|nr:YeeE/YedE thiosulfate transporter family protein [Planctomycetota bacterium]
IVKFMLSAVIVGMIGLYVLVHFGLASLSVKPARLGANVIGGLLFGAGWALFGYCPGTSLGALGEGRWHVLAGIAGMLVGAGVYAEVAPFMMRTVGTWGDFGRVTLPDVLGVSPRAVIGGFVLVGAVLCLVFEKKRL